MIFPSRRQNEIAAMHLDTLALNSSEAAISLDDESASECGVSVCGSSLTRHDQLKTSVKRVGGVGRI